MTISVPSLHRVVPIKFFHFVSAKSSEAKPSLVPFMSGRLYCFGLHGVEELQKLSHVASAISLLSDKSLKLVLQEEQFGLGGAILLPQQDWVEQSCCYARIDGGACEW